MLMNAAAGTSTTIQRKGESMMPRQLRRLHRVDQYEVKNGRNTIC